MDGSCGSSDQDCTAVADASPYPFASAQENWIPKEAAIERRPLPHPQIDLSAAQGTNWQAGTGLSPELADVRREDS